VPNKRKSEPAGAGIGDFEKNLQELETLVERLERGDLGLEESLKQFERGIRLTRACQMALQAAEQKVEMLSHKEGKETIEPAALPDDNT
jgi:exodeoxyribonuclease VII small subunit